MKGFCVSTIPTEEPVDDLKAAALLSKTQLKLDMTEASSNWAELDCESMRGVLLIAARDYTFNGLQILQGGATYVEQLGRGNSKLQHYIISVLPRNIL